MLNPSASAESVGESTGGKHNSERLFRSSAMTSLIRLVCGEASTIPLAVLRDHCTSVRYRILALPWMCFPGLPAQRTQRHPTVIRASAVPNPSANHTKGLRDAARSRLQETGYVIRYAGFSARPRSGLCTPVACENARILSSQ